MVYGFSLSRPQFKVSFTDQASAPSCLDGQKQYCRVASCSGFSTCVGGTWGGCEWVKVCNPGERIPCLKEGCSYAYKICNECGTEYGSCTGFNQTENLINENSSIIN
ncbi:hypothetical protein HY990_06505 [Candidatus Micrarchaeota archaeon]|nr:hypothetical protein [Candidatus Micrarchaeota archaeon]